MAQPLRFEHQPYDTGTAEDNSCNAAQCNWMQVDGAVATSAEQVHDAGLKGERGELTFAAAGKEHLQGSLPLCAEPCAAMDV
eukprot:2705853-Amphidinium_carterae.1